MRPLILAALALMIAACAKDLAPRAGTARIDDGFIRGGAQWYSGGLILFALAARPVTFEGGQRLAICGAWTVSGEAAMTTHLTDEAVATGTVQLGGRNVLRRPDRFPRLPDGAPLAGAEAECLVTPEPWSPEMAGEELRLRFVRQNYDCDFDDGFGGCQVFREL